MPLIKLEYSNNIKETFNTKEFFSSCHKILVDTIDADKLRCQSKASCYDVFHVGNGSKEECFIYLEVSLLEGRSLSKLQNLGSHLLTMLESYFSLSLKELKVQMSVRIVEMPSNLYFKKESGR